MSGADIVSRYCIAFAQYIDEDTEEVHFDNFYVDTSCILSVGSTLLTMAAQLMGSLEDCLTSIQHHDQGIRRSGEILFYQFQSHVDYVEIVTRFASDVNKPAHFRQLVILLLNQQIGKDWRSFSQTSKASLIQFSFNGCNDQINIIRSACMHMLSKIVSRSSESEIKEVLTYLCGLLSTPDTQVIASTLKCLCVIADEGNQSIRYYDQ